MVCKLRIDQSIWCKTGYKPRAWRNAEVVSTIYTAEAKGLCNGAVNGELVRAAVPIVLQWLALIEKRFQRSSSGTSGGSRSSGGQELSAHGLGTPMRRPALD